jgi:hypothetical protein
MGTRNGGMGGIPKYMGNMWGIWWEYVGNMVLFLNSGEYCGNMLGIWWEWERGTKEWERGMGTRNEGMGTRNEGMGTRNECKKVGNIV